LIFVDSEHGAMMKQIMRNIEQNHDVNLCHSITTCQTIKKEKRKEKLY